MTVRWLLIVSGHIIFNTHQKNTFLFFLESVRSRFFSWHEEYKCSLAAAHLREEHTCLTTPSWHAPSLCRVSPCLSANPRVSGVIRRLDEGSSHPPSGTTTAFPPPHPSLGQAGQGSHSIARRPRSGNDFMWLAIWVRQLQKIVVGLVQKFNCLYSGALVGGSSLEYSFCYALCYFHALFIFKPCPLFFSLEHCIVLLY